MICYKKKLKPVDSWKNIGHINFKASNTRIPRCIIQLILSQKVLPGQSSRYICWKCSNWNQVVYPKMTHAGTKAKYITPPNQVTDLWFFSAMIAIFIVDQYVTQREGPNFPCMEVTTAICKSNKVRISAL